MCLLTGLTGTRRQPSHFSSIIQIVIYILQKNVTKYPNTVQVGAGVDGRG